MSAPPYTILVTLDLWAWSRQDAQKAMADLHALTASRQVPNTGTHYSVRELTLRLEERAE